MKEFLMRVFYFPDWVFKALSAQGHQRADVLNEQILVSTLSVDDVAFISYIQRNLQTIVPPSVISSFPGCVPYDFIGDKLTGEDNDAFYNRRMEYCANGTPEPYYTPYDNLTVDMFDENTIVFSPIKPVAGFLENDAIGADRSNAKLDLLDRVIQQVYPYVSFPDLALTPMLRDYMQEKQQQQRM
jgi:hypothetical protein